MGAIPKTVDEADETASPYPPIIPNAETIAAMEDARAGRNMEYFDSIEALMADLRAAVDD
ncbi:hypothetical protein FACS1894205_3290 [Alphaproteobacteria bacterium]|nr:hypothetical protein FACS1894205_3290 [Alphaproteobacteria bacterium]